MINKKNQSFYYLSSMSIYDVHVTTKSYNIDEYKKMGAKKVVFIDNAFDPSLHRPMQLTKKEISEFGSSVGFIGSYELDRFQSIEYLCKNGVEVKVYGKSWSDLKNKIPNLIVDSNDYFDNDYVKILNCIDINLCFLRKQNRDLQTTRTLEITACGRFMIAERTVEHLRLFDENNEVVFFEDDSELLEKVRYYLDKKDLREQIGNSARIRCIESRYDNLSRIEQVLNNINN
jgi:spore maturation protein CgeB